MKKKLLMVLISVSMIASVFTGCGNSTEAKDSGKAQTEQADTKEDSADKADEEQAALEDGTYTAEFQTDSSMFHVNEAMDGKGTLTVEDGKMTIHISLVSKNIVNLFEGTAEDAQKDGAELLQPTTDTINSISQELIHIRQYSRHTKIEILRQFHFRRCFVIYNIIYYF